MVLRGQPLAARAFELLASLVEIVDLEAEMMDAGEVRAVRAHIRRFLVLGVEDRDIDVAVGQKHRAVRAAPQLLEAEGRFVELGDLRRLVGGQGDVLDAGHDLLPSVSLREPGKSRLSLRAKRSNLVPILPHAVEIASSLRSSQ